MVKRLFFCFFSHSPSACTETPLPWVATGGAGDTGRAARRLHRLLHLTLSAVVDAHTRCPAHLCPRETVPPLLPAPQLQITVTWLTVRTSLTVDIAFVKPRYCLEGKMLFCKVVKKKVFYWSYLNCAKTAKDSNVKIDQYQEHTLTSADFRAVIVLFLTDTTVMFSSSVHPCTATR